MFTKRVDTTPVSGKGFLGALFSAGPTTVNREEMCEFLSLLSLSLSLSLLLLRYNVHSSSSAVGGVNTQHPIGDVARVDGKLTRVYGSNKRKTSKYATKEDRTISPEKSATGERSGYSSRRGPSSSRRTVKDRGGGSGTGLSGQMNKNLSVRSVCACVSGDDQLLVLCRH